jgi:hypothetical protein
MFCLKDSEKQIARLHRFHIIPNGEGGDGSLMSRVAYAWNSLESGYEPRQLDETG